MTEGEIRYLVSLCKSGITISAQPIERQEAMYALGRLEEFAAQHAGPDHVVLPVLPDDCPLCAEHEPDPEAQPKPEPEPEPEPPADHFREVTEMVPQPPRPRPAHTNEPLGDALLALLKARPGQDVTAGQLRTDLEARTGRSVTAEASSVALRRLSEREPRVTRVGWGVWRWSAAATPSSTRRPAAVAAPKPATNETRPLAGSAKGSANAYAEWNAHDHDIAYADFRDWWLAFQGQHGGNVPGRADWEARVKHLRTTGRLAPEPAPEPTGPPLVPESITHVRASCSPELGAKMHRLWEIKDAPVEEFVGWFMEEYAERGNAPMVEDWRARNRRAA